MPLVLAGATSGSATVQATDAQTVTLTLPASSGTIALTTGGGSPTFTSVTTGLGSAASPSITFTGDTNTGIFSPAADTIAFTEGGVESMRIDSSGNVLVGGTTQRLNAKITNNGAYWSGSGNSSGDAEYFLSNYATPTCAWTMSVRQDIGGANNDLKFLRLNSSGSFQDISMQITQANGYVGIGTISPATRLNIADSGAGVALQFNGYTGGQNIQAKIECERPNFNNFESQLRFYTHNGSTLAEKMRINESGALIVGATSTGGGNVNSFDFSPTDQFGTFSHAFNTADQVRYIKFQTNAGELGNIRQAGAGVSYNSASDYRLKENIAPLENCLNRVMQLKPVSYKWKDINIASEGFIAHELQEICSIAVTGEKDGMRTEQYEISPAIPATYDENGNELTPMVEAVMGEREVPEYQSVDTSFLVATLTAAIQEQQAIITDLKARIETLENT